MNKVYQDFLAHYGVKGQQWGKRRFQNEDGSLTSEGRQHYGISEQQLQRDQLVRESYNRRFAEERAAGKKPSARRLQLEKEYREKGFTEEDAQIHAYRKAKAERALKIAGGVALAAALAYGGYKGAQWIRNGRSRVIKQGSQIQRMTANANEDTARAAYVAVNAKDKLKYRGMYGKQLQLGSSGNAAPYQINMEAGKNIRVAGDRAGKKAYKSLMKNDPSFAKNERAIQESWERQGQNAMLKMHKRSKYEQFNTRLVDHTKEGSENAEKFYNELKRRGYGGVLDVNDHRFSGYGAKKPVILFDQKTNIANRSISKIEEYKMNRDYKEAYKLVRNDAIRNTAVKSIFGDMWKTSLWGGAAAGLAGLRVRSANKSAARTASRNQALIREYKREHPNTKLTDQKILKLQLGGN